MAKKILILLLLIATATSVCYAKVVKGYYRSDGTYVRPHLKTKPDKYKFNNISTQKKYIPNSKQRTKKRTSTYNECDF